MTEVSVFSTMQVLDAIASYARDENRLVAEFKTIFEEVIVLEASGPELLPNGVDDPGFRNFVIDLWANHQPYATLICRNYGIESKDFLQGTPTTIPDNFTCAAFSNLECFARRRILCVFDYWDPEKAVQEFILQAETWRSKHVGNGVVDNDPISVRRTSAVDYSLAPSGGPWAMTIALLAAGAESQVRAELLIDM